jgi:hypothetical protein
MEDEPGPTRDLRFGTWNIKTLTGKENELIQEMKRNKVECMGISETRRKGVGELTMDNQHICIYSGIDRARRASKGVGIVLTPNLRERMEEWRGCGPRMISLILNLENKLGVIQVYAPTEDTDILEKEQFYVDLMKELNRLDQLVEEILIMGDLNARIGQRKKGEEEIRGKFHGDTKKNENGKRMIELCIENKLKIGNTMFPHKIIHQVTFEAEGRPEAKSIIDYMIYNREFGRIVTDVKVIRGAEIGSDHRLLILDTKRRIHKIKKQKGYSKIDIGKLTGERRKVYCQRVEMELRYWKGEEEVDQEKWGIEKKWKILKDTLIEAAELVCGRKYFTEKMKRTSWWTEEIRKVIQEKKAAWRNYIKTKTDENWQKYVEGRRTVKREVMAAKKRSWIEFGERVKESYEKDRKYFWTTIK